MYILIENKLFYKTEIIKFLSCNAACGFKGFRMGLTRSRSQFRPLDWCKGWMGLKVIGQGFEGEIIKAVDKIKVCCHVVVSK